MTVKLFTYGYSAVFNSYWGGAFVMFSDADLQMNQMLKEDHSEIINILLFLELYTASVYICNVFGRFIGILINTVE